MHKIECDWTGNRSTSLDALYQRIGSWTG